MPLRTTEMFQGVWGRACLGESPIVVCVNHRVAGHFFNDFCAWLGQHGGYPVDARRTSHRLHLRDGGSYRVTVTFVSASNDTALRGLNGPVYRQAGRIEGVDELWEFEGARFPSPPPPPPPRTRFERIDSISV